MQKKMVKMVASMEDAKATVKFEIFNQLVARAPRSAYPFIEELAQIAASAVENPATAWAFEQVANANRPDVE
jgi:hypothetical protein